MFAVGGVGGGAGTVGLQNHWDMPPKCFNLRIGVLVILKVENTMKPCPVCLSSFLHNKFLFFFYFLLLQNGDA